MNIKGLWVLSPRYVVEAEYMRGAEDVQLCVKPDTKAGIDGLKLHRRDDILRHLGKKKRFVSNDDVVRFLLSSVGKGSASRGRKV